MTVASQHTQNNSDQLSPLVIYTAIFGDYDDLRDPIVPGKDCKYVCFTDRTDLTSEVWEIRQVVQQELSPAMANRRIKILAHEYLPNYQVSLYVDGNIELIGDPRPLIDDELLSEGFLVAKHPERNCLFDEARECLVLRRANLKNLQAQTRRYSKEGMPRQFGLGENFVMLRLHLRSDIRELMEDWWVELSTETQRDQLSLPYVLWKIGRSFRYLKHSPRDSNLIFQFTPHKIDRQEPILRKILSSLRIRTRRMIIRMLRPF